MMAYAYRKHVNTGRNRKSLWIVQRLFSSHDFGQVGGGVL